MILLSKFTPIYFVSTLLILTGCSHNTSNSNEETQPLSLSVAKPTNLGSLSYAKMKLSFTSSSHSSTGPIELSKDGGTILQQNFQPGVEYVFDLILTDDNNKEVAWTSRTDSACPSLTKTLSIGDNSLSFKICQDNIASAASEINVIDNRLMAITGLEIPHVPEASSGEIFYVNDSNKEVVVPLNLITKSTDALFEFNKNYKVGLRIFSKEKHVLLTSIENNSACPLVDLNKSSSSLSFNLCENRAHVSATVNVIPARGATLNFQLSNPLLTNASSCDIYIDGAKMSFVNLTKPAVFSGISLGTHTIKVIYFSGAKEIANNGNSGQNFDIKDGAKLDLQVNYFSQINVGGSVVIIPVTPTPTPTFETIRIASYNVENLWDDIPENSPAYAEFRGTCTAQDTAATCVPNNWYRDNMAMKKAKRAAEVIAIANCPEVLGIEELENGLKPGSPTVLRSLELLQEGLATTKCGRYPFSAFADQSKIPGITITTALLSKFPFEEVRTLYFDTYGTSYPQNTSLRSPLVVVVNAKGSKFRVYVNHWPSQSKPENALLRNLVADLVRADLNNLLNKKDIVDDNVIIGDFNSDYTEESHLAHLYATGDESKLQSSNEAESNKYLYNTWMDRVENERCSYTYQGKRQCIDNIIINKSLFDSNGLQYVEKSITRIGESGEAKLKLSNIDGSNFRTQMQKSDTFVTHLDLGYSDHHPVSATFKLMGTGSRELIPFTPASTTTPTVGKYTNEVPYCTNAKGELIDPASVVNLSSTVDLSDPSSFFKCYSLTNGDIEIKAVDTYNGGKTSDYGFTFLTYNPTLSFVVVKMQYDYAEHVGNSKKMSAFLKTVKDAIKAGQKVTLTSIKGRLGFDFGKLTLYAEDAPVLKVQ